MVDQEKLLEWVQEKLRQGVDEQRIRKSLKETGHDPALVEKAKDPFSGSEPGERSQEEQVADEFGEEKNRPDDREKGRKQDDRKGGPAEKREGPEKGQETPQGRENRAKDEGSREPSLGSDDRSQTDDKSSREPSRDRETSQTDDQSSGRSGREPSIDISRDSQPQDTGRRNKQASQKDDRKGGPQKPRQTEQSRRPPENQVSNDDSGFSLPSFSMPSFDLNMPSVPWRTVGALLLVLVIAGGGFAAYQSGLFSGLQAPDLPLDNGKSSPDPDTEDTGTQSEPVCPDVGVRIRNAEISGSSTDVDVKLFGGQITGLVELYEGDSIVASEQFEISDTESVTFGRTGDKVVFRPYGCDDIKDTYRLN